MLERAVIYNDLRRVGCCKRCCLRFMGEKDSSSFINVEEYLLERDLESQNLENGQAAKQIKSNPCIACIGLLQIHDGEFVEKISEEVKIASYDCKKFTCALSLPISYQLRAYSLWLYVNSKFPEFYTFNFIHSETQIISIKEVWKWVTAPLIAKCIDKELDAGDRCDFFVGVNVTQTDDEQECACLQKMEEDFFRERKVQKRKFHGTLYTRKAIESLLPTIDKDVFKENFPCPPPVASNFATCSSVSCSHNSIYIAGRYNKFSRTLSQTPWVIAGERKMESSVQEIICDSIKETSRADDFKFISSGREDVDVRMLGRGRPFACDLVNPRKTIFTPEDMRNLEKVINAKSTLVAVRDLQVVSKESLKFLKEGEQEKKKVYMALCISSDPISPSDFDKLSEKGPIELSQKTPIRVLHRRPLAVRSRTVHSMAAWPLDVPSKKGLFKLKVTTQAGTYIKEFVHGDFGRTRPNLGELLGGVSVDILALDVEEIVSDWPPTIES